MPHKLRLAIVSVTGSGRKRTLPALADSALVEVLAIHGRNAHTTAEVGEQFRVPHVYSDIAGLLRERRFDFVMLCSPPFLHRQQAQQFLSHRIPVLVEKPLAHRLDDAQAIVAAARAAGVPVRVAHQLRHQPTYRAIRRWIAQGAIGRPLTATFEWSFALNRDAPSSQWKLDPSLNGPNGLTDAGIHCLDVAVGLFGPGRRVNLATSTPPDTRTAETCVLTSRHNNGTLVTITASREYGPYANDLRISGSLGTIEGRGFFTEQSAAQVVLRRPGHPDEVVARGPNPYAAEVEDFAALVAGRPGGLGTTGEEAVEGLELALG